MLHKANNFNSIFSSDYISKYIPLTYLMMFDVTGSHFPKWYTNQVLRIYTTLLLQIRLIITMLNMWEITQEAPAEQTQVSEGSETIYHKSQERNSGRGLLLLKPKISHLQLSYTRRSYSSVLAVLWGACCLI